MFEWVRSLQSDAEWKKTVVDLIKESRGKLLTALAGAALGISGLIGFWLSPMKLIVMHGIWHESASLTVLIPQEVHVGEPVRILVQVMPSAAVPVSEGVMSVVASDPTIVVKSGNASSTTPQIGAPVILLKEEPLILQAAAPGSFVIIVKLKTPFGEYKSSANIIVRPLNQPTKENLSGQWYLRIGLNLGTMELIHRGAEVSGIYRFPQTHIRGSIAGFVDGKTFNADFVEQGETRRKWLVRALYMQTDNYIEISGGDVTRQILKDNDWTQSGKPQEFYATSDPKR